MSEYQYYEFLALDRPLTADELAKVRDLSSRAEITATSFASEYNWGDFRGNPDELMRRYYDAHLYLASWGTHRIMLRLPRAVLDPAVAEQYCVHDRLSVSVAGEHVIIELVSEDEPDDWEDEDAGHSLAAIADVRAELAVADMRTLYLAWLATWGINGLDEDYLDEEYEEEDEELPPPPVPAGLGSLTGAQRALADFLRVDQDLLEAAASVSPPLTTASSDADALTSCIASLEAAEKDRLLLLAGQGGGARVRLELLHMLHRTSVNEDGAGPRRTVAELLETAARHRREREERESAARGAEQARRDQELALAREKRLDSLARDPEKAWTDVNRRIRTRVPTEYDAAVSLLTDLRELARRAGRDAEFERRFVLLRHEHQRKPTLIERFDRVGLVRSPLSRTYGVVDPR